MPLPLDAASEPFVVDSAGRFIINPLHGVGVSFIPHPSNIGGFPLTVIADDDEKSPVTVRGPGYFRADSIQKLEVRASAGGGRQGDRWYATVLPSIDSREEPRLSTDVDGHLKTRSAGGRVLFDIDTLTSQVPLLDAFASGNTGIFYFSPVDPGQIIAELTAWDISRFSNVLFSVEHFSNAGGLSWSCEPFVDFASATDSGQSLLWLKMGSIGNFGLGTWPSNTQGYIHCGTTSDAETEMTYSTPRKLAYARFGLQVDVNAENWVTVDWGQNYFRFRGVAW